MLRCFSKYLCITNSKTIININYKVTTTKNTYIYKNNTIKLYSLFSRKAVFRSLITYINTLYASLDTPAVNNYFYFSTYVISANTHINPGFLFKKYYLK